MMDDRQRSLHEWVQGLSCIPIHKWEPLKGDASFRRYFRSYFQSAVFNGVSHAIAVDSPPDHENQKIFLAIRQLLAGYNLPVPALFSEDSTQGFMLLNDFGDHLLHSELLRWHRHEDKSRVGQWYLQSFDLIKLMQSIEVEALADLPAYDEALLSKEMQLFDDWFIVQYLQLSLDEKQQQQLFDVKSLLIQSALSQPQVFVHRDFHSRNVMIKEDGTLGLIDFQDAVVGPVTYDAVSLLKDAYMQWPRQQYVIWLNDLYCQLSLTDVSFDTFLRWFDWIGLQRHLKVLGIFARLKLRDKKLSYEQYFPCVMQYVLEVTRIYPEFDSLDRLLYQQVLPRWQQLYGVVI